MMVDFFHRASPSLRSNAFRTHFAIWICPSLNIVVSQFDRIIRYKPQGFGFLRLELATSIPIGTDRIDPVILNEEGLDEFLVIDRMDTAVCISATEIAAVTGFSSEYALNRFFKYNEGYTLGQYRRLVTLS